MTYNLYMHHRYNDTDKYVETILEVPSSLAVGSFEHLVYTTIASSGNFITNLKLKTGRDNGIVDESTLPQPPEIPDPENPWNPPEDNYPITIDNLLSGVRSSIMSYYTDSLDDYNNDKDLYECIQEANKLPDDIIYICVYKPRGLTNEQVIYYIRKDKVEAFEEWLINQDENWVDDVSENFYASPPKNGFKLQAAFALRTSRWNQRRWGLSSYPLNFTEWAL